MRANAASFSSFSHCNINYNFNNTNWKRIGVLHGIQTRGHKMVGVDETTDKVFLWEGNLKSWLVSFKINILLTFTQCVKIIGVDWMTDWYILAEHRLLIGAAGSTAVWRPRSLKSKFPNYFSNFCRPEQLFWHQLAEATLFSEKAFLLFCRSNKPIFLRLPVSLKLIRLDHGWYSHHRHRRYRLKPVLECISYLLWSFSTSYATKKCYKKRKNCTLPT